MAKDYKNNDGVVAGRDINLSKKKKKVKGKVYESDGDIFIAGGRIIVDGKDVGKSR